MREDQRQDRHEASLIVGGHQLERMRCAMGIPPCPLPSVAMHRGRTCQSIPRTLDRFPLGCFVDALDGQHVRLVVVWLVSISKR